MYSFKNETCLPAGDHLASMTVCLSISLSHYCVSLTHTDHPAPCWSFCSCHNSTFVSPSGVSFVHCRLPKSCFLPMCSLAFCKNTVPPGRRVRFNIAERKKKKKTTLGNIFRAIINYINIYFQSLLESNYILTLDSL